MTTLNATEARAKLYSLIDEAATTHQPILITGKRGNAVLLSEEDWNAIKEMLHLLSVPGMRESIKEGLQTPIEDCAKDLDWRPYPAPIRAGSASSTGWSIRCSKQRARSRSFACGRITNDRKPLPSAVSQVPIGRLGSGLMGSDNHLAASAPEATVGLASPNNRSPEGRMRR